MIEHKKNYRVEVYPKTRVYGIEVSEESEVCKQIAEQIKRHVDNTHGIYVAYDSKWECEKCASQYSDKQDCKDCEASHEAKV